MWRTQGFVEEFALGGLQAAQGALLQTSQQLQAIEPEERFATVPYQRRAFSAQQLAGLATGREDLPAQADRQQALPRGLQVLAAAVEGQHDVLRIAGVEHPAFNLADSHAQ